MTTNHGFIIAAPRSGEGKTTIACGIMAALVRRGLSVQPYKVGPDYVDPAFHSVICGRTSINLDSWMVPEHLVQWSFAKRTKSAQVAVVEGVMGLFDGGQGPGKTGSTGEVADLLGLKVILVVDVAKMAGSAAALVAGFASFQPGVEIAGVIVNRVGSLNHYQTVKVAIQESTGIPVLGGIGRDNQLEIPSLQQQELFSAWMDNAAQLVEDNLDLDRLLALTTITVPRQVEELDEVLEIEVFSPRPRIAVASDRAFDSYYQDNLELIKACGGELFYFSPLKDESLPKGCNGIYLSGRFSADFAEELARNEGMKSALRKAHQMGLPILAECGGLIYLTQGYQHRGQTFPLVGLIPARSSSGQRLVGMGYRQVVLKKDTVLGSLGGELRGHEFHHTYLIDEVWNGAIEMSTSSGRELGETGFVDGNLFASHIHLHFFSNPQVINTFLSVASQTI